MLLQEILLTVKWVFKESNITKNHRALILAENSVGAYCIPKCSCKRSKFTEHAEMGFVWGSIYCELRHSTTVRTHMYFKRTQSHFNLKHAMKYGFYSFLVDIWNLLSSSTLHCSQVYTCGS